MAIQVETKDSTALTDADLDEMASMGGALRDRRAVEGQGGLGPRHAAPGSRASCTGYAFSTLERIGGTPCVLLGLLSVRRTSKRDAVLKGLMGEAVPPGADGLPRRGRRGRHPLRPRRRLRGVPAARPTSSPAPATGPSARSGRGAAAWPSASASTAPTTSRRSSSSPTASRGFLDHETLKPEKIDPDVAALFRGVTRPRAASLIVYGWTMAEDLLKLGCPLTEADRVAASLDSPTSSASPSRDDPGLRSGPAGRRRRCSTTWSTWPARAPSAGKTQGWHLVVLEGAETARFWDVTLPPERRCRVRVAAAARRPGHRAAPGRSRGLRAPLRRARQGGERARPVGPRPGRCRTGRSTRRSRS